MEQVVNVLNGALQQNNISLDSSIPSPSQLVSTEAVSLSTGPNAATTWRLLCERLADRLDQKIYSAWIKPLSIQTIHINSASDGESEVELKIAAPNKFSAEHLEKNYSQLISSLAAESLEVASARVMFVISPSITPATTNGASASNTSRLVTKRKISDTDAVKPIRTKNGRDESNLNPNYNFSNIVVGSCNQFAHAVGLRIAENLGTVYNPLFIYGGVGLGKTHLANAIGNAARRRGKKVLLVSSEQFVSELIAAIRANSMQQFKSKFRSLDLLIIDDVQFIIGKERTQEEFFHTFNELHQRHKQIVLTSDKVPQELVGLEERLRTRFASGISADLQAPDFETRVAILSKKAEAAGVMLTDNVSRVLARRIDTNVRELEGALNRLVAFSSLHQSPITAELAEKVLQQVAPEKRMEVTTEMIQNVVAKKFNVSVGDLLGKRRTQNIAIARQVAMYLCRTLARCSYPEIGALFGGRDHSTAIHAKRVVEERIQSCDKFRSDVESLQQNFSPR